MWQNAHDTYLESRILSADPIELTGMLYESAIGAVKDARAHLAAGEIAARARSISKVSSILFELTSALDHERGGQISANLARLYDYLLRRLTEANLAQSDAIVEEVQGLLKTMAEGWEGVKAQQKPAPAPQPAPSAGGSWEQPGSGQSEGSSGDWRPVDATPTTYERSWEPASYVPEPVAAASVERPAAVKESVWEPPVVEPEVPVVDNNNPWTGPASYGSAWMTPDAGGSGSSHHDWSL